MTLEERIKVLEDRVALLEQLQVPTTPYQPLYPWHEESTPPYQLPVTWCCARNTHHDGEPSE